MSAKRESAQPGAKKQGWKIALGILVSVFFLGLALYNINFPQLITTFAKMQPGWIALAAGLVLGSYFLRALLWQQLIGRRRKTRLWNLFRIITIGYLANNLLPLKLGEVIRAWLLGRCEQLPTTLAIGTVVLERIVDLLSLLFYFTLMLFFIPFAPWLKLSGLILAGIGLMLIGAMAVSYRYGERFTAALEKPLLRLLPGKLGAWLHEQLARFLEGLRLIETPGQVLKVLLCGLLTWLGWMGVAYACSLAFGLPLPFLSAVFLIVVLNFGLMIPSSPGGLGVFEFMVILALSPYGVSKEAALGVGFSFHMIHYLITIPLGWLFALQMNVSMHNLVEQAEQPGENDGKTSACAS